LASPSPPGSPGPTCSSASSWSRRSPCSASPSASSGQVERDPRLLKGESMAIYAADTPSPVLPIWQEIVIGLAAFGVVFFVLAKYVFPRMEQTFKARVDAIEGGI